MPLNLYLDDCAYAKQLVLLLRNAGHLVRIPSDGNIQGMADPVHLQFAIDNDLILITKNPHDFELLHRSNSSHPGILAICQDNDPTRDMSYAEIVKAIANIENAGVPLRNAFHVLNHWRY